MAGMSFNGHSSQSWANVICLVDLPSCLDFPEAELGPEVLPIYEPGSSG